jgi:PAS domain S-box-containing protein
VGLEGPGNAGERTPESLAYHAGFAQLIATISRDFIAMASDQIDRGIQAALRAIGEYAGVDRAFLLGLTDDLSLLVNTHEWCTDPVVSRLKSFQGLPTNALSSAASTIANRRVICVPRVSELPPEAGAERDIWESIGSKSLIILPLEAAGKLLGALALDTVRDEREWSDDLIASLGTVGEVLANALDRKRKDDALRESEERFRTLVENAYDLITNIDAAGRILFASPNHAEILGWGASELLGTSFSEYLHPDDRELVPFRFEQVFSSGVATATFRVRHKDGAYRWLECTARTYDTPKNEGRIVSISRDITGRKRAEEALQESEEKYRAIFESASDAIFTVRMSDEGPRFADFNPAALELHRCKPEELLGASPADFAPAVQPDGRSTEERIAELSVATMAGKTEFFEWRHLRKDGTTFDAEATLSPVSIGGERYLQAIVRDITERKRAEERRLSLERQLQHAQKLESLGVLAGGIAHDFNNILMVILGNADLALDELSPMSPARGHLQEIEKASKRAAELAKQMLAYSGKGRFVVEPIDAAELVEEMAHLLAVSISKKAVLRYNFADNLPSFDGDVTQVRQVVMNLITNASEAIGEKSGVIALSTGALYCDRAYLDDIDEVLRVSSDGPLREGVYTYFEVADTGCGMDAESIERIFDPFFTTKFTGRGLGMSAVLGIVRGHRGAIKIHSEVGKGTTFKVLFPANELAAKLPTREPSETNEWRGSGTVLLVDDEEAVLRVLQRIVEGMGFQVLSANDGREALDVFRARGEEIACVLLDLTMPRLDGEQVFREIRRMRPDAKVILSSGCDESDVKQRFAGEGVAGFIQKPYRSDSLGAKLRDVLGT